jgi:AraC family transcriptional regulator of adaptative response/methylated-DNA-[protein]-cysteine methyltransferase
VRYHRGAVTRPCLIRTIDSPLGPLVAGARADGVCLLEFSDPRRLDAQLAALARRLGVQAEDGGAAHLDRLQDELHAYFSGRLTRFTVPLVVRGTPFEERVWAALQRIPYGETRSYDALARAIGAPSAARAVGGANGRNRLAILIPCHRVINKDGGLGGYGGALWRKQMLLGLEGARTGIMSPS